MRTQESETWLDYSKGKNNHNKYNCSGLLQKCARSDWSRFVSCLTKTTSCELITAGAQNFKMAALHLVNNSGNDNVIEENLMTKSTKDAF